MAGNTFGRHLTLTSFGESHGAAVGGILDGMPAGVHIDTGFVQEQLNRRRPGTSRITTARREADELEIVSGIFEGRSTGAPIAFFIRNTDQRPKDYDHNKDVYRPSHADYTYDQKYGFRDHRGGGRSSARETAARVAGGAIAMNLLRLKNISITAWVSAVGDVELTEPFAALDLTRVDESIVRCPDPVVAGQMISLIETVKKQGDSVGGIISCVIRNVPPGLGEPVFGKLHADLGSAMLGINAVKGFEYGSGFASSRMKGSEHNDAFTSAEGAIRTRSNHSGGIQGGISNGNDIFFRVAFKPVATILQEQETVNAAGETVTMQGRGRHDPCVVPRAVPIVEAMAALVIADHYLRNTTSDINKL